MAALERYSWPGNVRELQNIVERACALAEGDRITRGDLPAYLLEWVSPAADTHGTPAGPARDGVGTSGPTLTLREAKRRWLEDLEGAYLRDLLAQHGGNISAAAKVAGIDRKTFHRLLSRYGVR